MPNGDRGFYDPVVRRPHPKPRVASGKDSKIDSECEQFSIHSLCYGHIGSDASSEMRQIPSNSDSVVVNNTGNVFISQSPVGCATDGCGDQVPAGSPVVKTRVAEWDPDSNQSGSDVSRVSNVASYLGQDLFDLEKWGGKRFVSYPSTPETNVIIS